MRTYANTKETRIGACGANLIDEYIQGYVDNSTLMRMPIEEVQSAYTLGFALTEMRWYTFSVLSFAFAVFIIVFALTYEGAWN